jgi:hypothetical protein
MCSASAPPSRSSPTPPSAAQGGRDGVDGGAGRVELDVAAQLRRREVGVELAAVLGHADPIEVAAREGRRVRGGDREALPEVVRARYGAEAGPGVAERPSRPERHPTVS